MSDRVLVMREGRQMGIFDRAEATQEAIMTAAMGTRQLTQSVESLHERHSPPLPARADPRTGAGRC